jgi:hypothetical protein
MLRTSCLALLMGVISLGAAAADQPAAIHRTESEPTGHGPTSAASMNQRFEDAAQEYAGQNVPRVALSDIAYPLDRAEFQAMDGFGVIWIAVVSQEKDELPLKRVYAVVDGKQVDLQLATSDFAATSGSALVQKTLGPIRWDGLYYLPVYLAAHAQKVIIDFAKNRSGFVMLDMEQDPQALPDYLSGPIAKPKAARPPAGAAFTLITREYPGYFNLPAHR